MAFLEVRNVTKAYEGHLAIKDLNFSIPDKKIFGLLGPNGAGKTTLIRIINQITAADSGEVIFDGEKLQPKHIERIGYLPEERGLYKKMKVLEQVVYFGRLKNLSKQESEKRALHWLNKFGLNDWKYKRIDELSKGMAQKVQFILTVLHQPDLIILDEPFSGFDPVNTELIKSEIKELNKAGATIIFSTHRMESVEEICDYVGMINKSQKVLEGSVMDVRNSYKKNEFEVEYKGSLDGFVPQPASVEINDDTKVNKATFVIDWNEKKELINKLNQQVDIESFNENLPSINDIFIAKVKEGNNG
ncbi:MAG: ATP-binding cassette domain-containing protein [Flavobacteriales bacterium]|nr:ATP-binding cassette domain-containing protein [Flavobacteriales bacterium]